MITLAYVTFAVIEAIIFDACTDCLFTMAVWFLIQFASTFLVQIIINAIGEVYCDVQMLVSERDKFTKSLAKNVIVLQASDKSILCASI